MRGTNAVTSSTLRRDDDGGASSSVPGAGFQKKVRSIPGAAPVVPGQASSEDAKKPRRKKKTEGDDGVVLPARDDLTEKSSTAGILSLPKAAATETVVPQPEGPTEKKIRKLSKKVTMQNFDLFVKLTIMISCEKSRNLKWRMPVARHSRRRKCSKSPGRMQFEKNWQGMSHYINGTLS